MRRLLSYAVAGCLGLMLVAAFFRPLLSAPYGTLPSTYPDACEVVWTVEHTRRFFSGTEPSLYRTAYLFHPFGASLFAHATVEGVILPLTAMFGDISPFGIYSFACAAAFALNFLAALLLFSRLCASAVYGALLAMLFSFHPYFIAHLDAGQLNLLCAFPLLLSAHAAAEIVRGCRQPGRWGGVLVLSVAFMALTNLYYLYFTALMWIIGALVTVCIRRAPRGALLRISAGIAAGFAIAGWKLYLAYQVLSSGEYTRDHAPRAHSADLVSYLLPGNYQLLSGGLQLDIAPLIEVNSGEAGVYLGFGLLLLAAVGLKFGLRHGERWVPYASAGACIFWLLSLGPEVQFLGDRVFPGYLYQALVRLLPAFPSVPARFSVIVIIALFMLAAYGVAALRSSGRSAYAAVLIILIALELYPSPLRQRGWAPAPAVKKLAADPAIRAVYDRGSTPWEAMMRQLVHGKPIVGGFISRPPKRPLQDYRRNKFVRYLENGEEAELPEILHGLAELDVQAAILTPPYIEQQQRLLALGFSKVLVFDPDVLIVRLD